MANNGLTEIKNATIVNEGKIFNGNVYIENDTIVKIESCDTASPSSTSALRSIDASGMYLMPGIIDTHVHFREPGLTEKADMGTESRAAVAGGVTSFIDMPNTKPQTTTIELLEEKVALAKEKSVANYGFMLGATNRRPPCHRPEKIRCHKALSWKQHRRYASQQRRGS